MNLFGFDVPMPVIAILIGLFVLFSMRKRKISSLRKEDKRLGLQLSIAEKKQRLKDIKKKNSSW